MPPAGTLAGTGPARQLLMARTARNRYKDDDAVADGGWIGQGAVGGILGGLLLMVGEGVTAAVTMGPAWALLPLRRAAGILLGPGAVEPSSPAGPVAIAGVLVHLTLAGMFGVLFAAIVSRRPGGIARRPGRILFAALAYGVGLWFVNYHAVAPVAGWDWFPQRSRALLELAGNALLYAPVLALYLYAVAVRVPGVVVAEPVERPLRRAA